MWADASVVDLVCLNDWGSAHAPGLMRNTVGTNPVYRCPQLGFHFERGQADPFNYGPVNDLSALFVSLLAFSLQPRRHDAEELPGHLPWERCIGNMQAVKTAYLSLQSDEAFWSHAAYRPEAQQLLSPLRRLLFVTSPTPPLEQLYAAFEQLGGSSADSSSAPAAQSLAAIPEAHTAASASSRPRVPNASTRQRASRPRL